MSCELRILSLLDDVEKCRSYLFPDNNDDSLWLRKCVVAVSPFGDRLVLAHQTAIIVLTAQWERGVNSASFVVSKQWDFQESQSFTSDVITSAIILPIVTVGNSSQGRPDWCCFIFGFSSGYLRFFAENLEMLAEIKLHSERVLQIKASSHRGRKDIGVDPSEVLFVVYPSVMCNIPGFTLFQTLRACRSEVAMKRARSDKTSPNILIEHKKFGFSASPVADACVVNSYVSNNFDHLLSVTIADGFNKNYRPSPPQQTLFAYTGPSSWLQLDYSTEGVTVPLELTDVALTVISKLPGWLGLSSNKTTESTTKPIEKLSPRCRLLDRRREGLTIVCSPDGSLLVVVDSLGRVSLVEARTGIAIRLWKGYRDAECGFLEVDEDIPKARHKHRHEKPAVKPIQRHALLLVIYVPKKGLIEIFPLRHGPRVAALRVSKNGRLLYVPHGLMGYTTPTTSRKGSSPTAHLVFLSGDGLMDFMVPFHCALMDTSKRAKDLHFMKQFKLCLKSNGEDDDTLIAQATAIVKQLTTDEVRLSVIDLVSSISFVTPGFLNAIIDAILETATDTDLPQSSGGSRNVVIICKQLRKAVKFYCALQDLPPDSESPVAIADEELPLTELLQLSDSEIRVLHDFLSPPHATLKKEGRVTFHVPYKGTLSRFLQCLDLSEDGAIMQAPKLSQEDYHAMGELMFRRVLSNEKYLQYWRTEAAISNINATLFAHCLVSYWLHQPIQHAEHDIRRFVLVMHTVSSLSDEEVCSADYNVESAWWTELRAVISQSRNTLNAMIASVCCRAVSFMCEQKAELLKSENPKHNTSHQGWETVSADTWQWDSLISRLEDVTVLNMVLSTKAPTARFGVEVSEVSLAELTTAGDNAVSELTAKWLCQYNIPPHLLVNESDAEFQAITPEATPYALGRKLLKGDEVFIMPLVEIGQPDQQGSESDKVALEKVQHLKRRFPFSLTSSVLLSHVAWELMGLWQQDLSNNSLINLAIDYFINIPSAHLKAVICSLAWSTYIKVHIEGITRLVSKMGKLPTDTLCVQEVGIPRGNISDVMQSAGRLLSTILDACAERPQVLFTQRADSLWTSSASAVGLISVAVSRPYPCEDLILLHSQMVTTIHMVAALEIKDKAVLSSLFDSMKNELFGELTARRTIALHHPNLSDVLLSFLRRAVSAAVQTIHEVESENFEVRVDAQQASHWLRVCIELGSTWRLPLDVLRRCYVCELYAAGYDRLAEEALSGVSDTALLASQLLVVVGKRIKSVISTSNSPHEVIATLSPSLTSWLNMLDEEGAKACKSSIADTELIMKYIIQHLPEYHIDSSLATLIAECISGLADIPMN